LELTGTSEEVDAARQLASVEANGGPVVVGGKLE
jgi:hypothetical protein